MNSDYAIILSATCEALPALSPEDQQTVAAGVAEALELSRLGLSRDVLSVATGWVRERHPGLSVEEARTKACVALWG